MRAREKPMRHRETVYCIAFCSVLFRVVIVFVLCVIQKLCERVCIYVFVSLYERVSTSYMSTVCLRYTNGKAFRLNEQQQNPFNRIQFVSLGSLKARKCVREREHGAKYCTRFEATTAHLFRTIPSSFVAREYVYRFFFFISKRKTVCILTMGIQRKTTNENKK